MNQTEQYLRLPQVVAITAIAKSTVWKWIKTNGFPSPIKLSPKCSAWKLSEVEAWMKNREVFRVYTFCIV